MFEFLLGLVVGFFLGIASFIAWGFYNLKKLEDNKKAALGKLAKDAEAANAKINSYKDRLLKVQELTDQQVKLHDSASEPSKNALHSKYKNGLNSEIRALEDQKAEILRSIIKDGFDPTVAVLNAEGVREQIKLSEYMTRAGMEMGSDDGWEEDPTAKKVGKFIVYKGGNSDTSH